MDTPGERVGAVLSADATTVNFFGYGVYDGDLDSSLGFPNPRITLDSGGVVWGYQCWWGSEDEVKKFIGDRTIVHVEPPA